jgi:hypothetical protein
MNAFQSILSLGQAPECIDARTLKQWLETARITTTSELLFGYSIGTVDEATPEDREHPRFIIDTQERYLGLARWNPTLQGWSIGGQIGQIMTIIKTIPGTVAADLAARPMAGWKVADGTTPGIPDLRPTSPDTENSFFQGSNPDWGIYTVGYIGA